MRPAIVAVCLSLASVAMPLAAQTSQPASAAKPTFGILAGFNSANIRGDGADGDSRSGFFVGANALFRLGTKIGFQPEVHYSQKGTRVNEDGINGTIALSYIDVPLYLRFDVPTSGAVKPYLLAGPQVAIRSGCTISGSGVSIECDEVSDFIGSEGDGFKRFDYGLSFGGGIDFPVSGRIATLTARYGYGLGDIADASSARNRLLQFGVGLKF
jgi:outer membrane immunogenic protein